MNAKKLTRAGAGVAILLALLAGCGSKQPPVQTSNALYRPADQVSHGSEDGNADWEQAQRPSTVWDLFGKREEPNVTLEVNKYIWTAALQVLDFLPVQSVDPFSGVIVTGYGTPPGGGRAYRATIHVTDPALDARSLKVALESRTGTVSPDTVRAIEDAILTRARQLRVADSKL